jgi:hypothetical protein
METRVGIGIWRNLWYTVNHSVYLGGWHLTGSIFGHDLFISWVWCLEHATWSTDSCWDCGIGLTVTFPYQFYNYFTSSQSFQVPLIRPSMQGGFNVRYQWEVRRGRTIWNVGGKAASWLCLPIEFTQHNLILNMCFRRVIFY